MNTSAPAAALTVLPPELIADLHRLNPWWTNQPAARVPLTHRHLAARVRRRLDVDIAPIVAVRGPRQVGKTTIQLQLIADLLDEGMLPTSILRVQFDELASTDRLIDPILRIAYWFEENIAPDRFNALDRQGRKAYLFLDEVQNLDNWSAQLKFLVDTVGVKVLVTASSALRIESGKDSLAGRIHTLEAGTLSLTEIGRFHRLDPPDPFLPDSGLGHLLHKEFWQELAEHGRRHSAFRGQTFRHFSERGGYPMAHNRAEVDWPLLSDQLNETVIQRVIQHDLRLGNRGRRRDAFLLEELFRLACRYAGLTPSYDLLADEARLSMGADVGRQRVANYLRFLADTMLLHLIPPLELRLKRRRGSPKLCLVDHGLRASWLQEQIPLAPEALAASPELSTMAGHIAESTLGATASGIPGLDIAHQPERGLDREVDFVFTVGDRRLPVEVKYQRRIDPVRDTLGLRAFVEKSANRAPFGLLITQTDTQTEDAPHVVSMPLSTFMLLA